LSAGGLQVLAEGLLQRGAEGVGSELLPARAGDREVPPDEPCRVEGGEGGEQEPLGQVAGGAEHDQAFDHAPGLPVELSCRLSRQADVGTKQ
jgi:hypothetical protein